MHIHFSHANDPADDDFDVEEDLGPEDQEDLEDDEEVDDDQDELLEQNPIAEDEEEDFECGECACPVDSDDVMCPDCGVAFEPDAANEGDDEDD